MAKTLDYQITLYPAHRDGAFVVTQFQMMANYPEKRMARAAAPRCAASPRANRRGSSARPKISISTWLT